MRRSQIVTPSCSRWKRGETKKGPTFVPAQSSEVGMYYWVGRISNAEAFGKGLDAWMSAQSDPNSGPAMVMARFRECVTNQSRAGYITR
jgi:hypothetical protein